jgi:hypothetical protein
MAYHITVLPQQMHISAEVGENLLSCLLLGILFAR